MDESPRNLNEGAILNLGTGSSVLRRDFLKGLMTAGFGVGGLSMAIETAYGKEPRGKPVVWTRDGRDRPSKVRLVSDERYRRLNVYKNFPIEKYTAAHSFVNKVTLVQPTDDEDDLRLKFHIDDVTKRKQRRHPQKLSGIPVEVEAKPVERTLHRDPNAGDGDTGCGDNQGWKDPLKSGYAISGCGDSGTLGVVARPSHGVGQRLSPRPTLAGAVFRHVPLT